MNRQRPRDVAGFLLRANLTLPEVGCMVALWFAMQMLALTPDRTPFSAAYMLAVMAVILLTRNVAAIATLVLVLAFLLRIAYPVSSWHDQHWIQWYSISALATGHSITMRSPIAGMSLASYLPQGDLFGGLIIAFGVQQYWLVWAIVAPLLFFVPVVLAPCATTLAVFIGMVWYWPFADYTNAGGNLEIQIAVLVAAIAAFRHGQRTLAIIFFAFASSLRQPALALVPFIFILLWQDKDYRNMKLYGLLLFLFSGIYLVLDPIGAYAYEDAIFQSFAQMWYNNNGGLLGNYSISSIPHAFGIADSVAWNGWKHIYAPLTALSILPLIVIAYRSRSRDTVLFLGILASVFIYVFARGYSQLHYVVAACFPFFALIGPAERPAQRFQRFFIRALGVLILFIGVAPLAEFGIAKASDVTNASRTWSELPISRERIVNGSASVDIPFLDGIDAHRELLSLSQGLEFDFSQPVVPSAMRLTTDHVQVQAVRGVEIWWPTETQARGIITRGTIEYSTDGTNFEPPVAFTNNLTYMAFPVTIRLSSNPSPVRAIRLRASTLYLDHKQWDLGNVEFFSIR